MNIRVFDESGAITKDDLKFFAENFTEHAIYNQSGIGDLSIIRCYKKCKENIPGIGRIMIWSLDAHLSGNCEEMPDFKRKGIIN